MRERTAYRKSEATRLWKDQTDFTQCQWRRVSHAKLFELKTRPVTEHCAKVCVGVVRGCCAWAVGPYRKLYSEKSHFTRNTRDTVTCLS